MYNQFVKSTGTGDVILAKLYMWAGVCFEISLYLWIYTGYIDYEGPLMPIIVLFFLISIILLALPSGYLIRECRFGIDFKRIDLLGYLKLLQLFVFFILMPALGKENIIFSVLIFGIISMLNGVNQLKIYKQIKEQITTRKLFDKMLYQTDKEVKNSALVGMAWKTLIPLLLWGLMGDHVLINLMIFMVIIPINAGLIFKFYKNAIKQIDDPSFKNDFIRRLYGVSIAFVILLIMSIIDPTNIFNYFVIGFIPTQFVNLIFKHTLHVDQSYQLNE